MSEEFNDRRLGGISGTAAPSRGLVSLLAGSVPRSISYRLSLPPRYPAMEAPDKVALLEGTAAAPETRVVKLFESEHHQVSVTRFVRTLLPRARWEGPLMGMGRSARARILEGIVSSPTLHSRYPALTS